MAFSFSAVDLDANPVVVSKITHNAVAQPDQNFTAGTTEAAIATALAVQFSEPDPFAAPVNTGAV